MDEIWPWHDRAVFACGIPRNRDEPLDLFDARTQEAPAAFIDFSSTHSTTVSTTFTAKKGSVDRLKESCLPRSAVFVL
jgi:hypothetical protein